MISRNAMLAMMMYILTSACNAVDQQPSAKVEVRGLADLPRVLVRGVESPYARYSEMTGQKDSHGRVFFLHPMTSRKNEILAAEFEPGMDVAKLFGGEDVIGTGGLVVGDERQARIEFLPISIPFGIAASQEWRIQYAEQQFVCRSRAAPATNSISGQIAVSCTGAGDTLNFLFDRSRGVTEFQDFCADSVCTYRLTDPQGLLSRAMTDFMGLPRL
jgi:hypothetical protein